MENGIHMKEELNEVSLSAAGEYSEACEVQNSYLCFFPYIIPLLVKTSEILQYSACGEANEYTNVKISNLCFFS